MSQWIVSACVLLACGACGSKTGLRAPEPREDAGVDAALDARPDARIDAGPIVPDECIELPPDEPPEFLDVSFVARIAAADVLFLVDVTGSMGEEIERIKETLRRDLVPAMADAIADVNLAVASFADYPVPPYGDGVDSPFALLQRSTGNVTVVQEAVQRLRTTSGGDGPESQVEALYQTATGSGRSRYVPAASCPVGTKGYPCFRDTGTPIILLFTDAEFHNGPGGSSSYGRELGTSAATYEETVGALRAIGAKVLGLFSGGGSPDALRDLRAIARDTGAVTPGGEPIVVDIGSRGERLDTGVIETVRTLVDEVPIDVDALAEPLPGEPFDASIFVTDIVARSAIPASGATMLRDRFERVRPGTTVVLRYVLANTTIPRAIEPQRFYFLAVLRGDGVTRLRESVVEIVVPSVSGEGCEIP